MKRANEMSLGERLAAPKPPFFKRLSVWGKVLVAVGGTVTAIATGGLGLPAYVAAIGAAVGSLGLGITAVSEATVDNAGIKPLPKETK